MKNNPLHDHPLFRMAITPELRDEICKLLGWSHGTFYKSLHNGEYTRLTKETAKSSLPTDVGKVH